MQESSNGTYCGKHPHNVHKSNRSLDSTSVLYARPHHLRKISIKRNGVGLADALIETKLIQKLKAKKDVSKINRRNKAGKCFKGKE